MQVVADESATAVADVEEQRFAFGHDLAPVLPSRPVEIDGDEPLSFGRVIGEEIELAADVCDDARLAGEVVYEVTQLPVVILEVDDGNGRFGRGAMPDVHDDKAPVLAHLGLRNPLRSIGLETSSSSCCARAESVEKDPYRATFLEILAVRHWRLRGAVEKAGAVLGPRGRAELGPLDQVVCDPARC